MTRTTIIIGLTLLPSLALAAEGPEARTKALVAAFMEVKTPPEGKTLTPEERKANAAAFEKLDGFFDWDTLAGAPFTPHEAKLGKDRVARLRRGFREVVRLVAYPDSGDFFKKAQWKITGVQGNDVTLWISMPEEDIETTVTFHFEPVGGELRIVDVDFDGASLIRDYTNQFGRIIAKHGPDDLVSRLEKRLAAERKARAGLLP